VYHSWLWQRVVGEKPREPIPSSMRSVASASQRTEPQALHLFVERPELPHIARDAEVAVMAT
jgi:hypothetical protein